METGSFIVSIHGSGLCEHLFDLRGEQAVLRRFQQRVVGQHGNGFRLCSVQGAGVVHQVGDLQGGQAVLSAAEKVAGAAGLKVELRHGKAVRGGAKELEPLLDALSGVVADKEAPALGGTSAHAAPQLVQGTQAVTLGILDDHDGGVGDIHAHLDDGGGYQCIQPAV